MRPRKTVTLEDLCRQRKFGPNGCWLWTGVKTNGYGICHASLPFVGHRVHRLAWMLANNSEIPTGLEIMHLCHNRSCFNPDHLKAGTHAENMKMSRGRGPRNAGERNRSARLSWADVLAIRADQRGAREIAIAYDLDTSYVWKIRHGRAWRENACKK